MIDRSVAEAAAEATEKEYCDSEMAKTEEKKTELEDDVAKLTARIDKAAATSAKLKDEAKELQAELAELAKLQAEMDKIRAEQNEAHLKAKQIWSWVSRASGRPWRSCATTTAAQRCFRTSPSSVPSCSSRLCLRNT